MKNYLSIGEVSKIKGISHRMLRYYDKNKVLVPAYTNEETGYRYYSKSQMIILDFILICTDLGIPLTRLNSFILDNGDYDVEKIIEVGAELATKKLKQLNDTLYRINLIKDGFQNNTTAYTGSVEKEFQKRYLITKEFNPNDYSLESYWASLSALYEDIVENNHTATINQGQCFLFSEQEVKSYTYVEVLKPKFYCKNIVTIPSGVFICTIHEENDFETSISRYDKPYKAGTIVVTVDVIEKQIRDKIASFEVQVLIK